MMHENRVWCVAPVVTAEELAEKLTQYTWYCCNGCELDGYLWLNDATGADGTQWIAARIVVARTRRYWFLSIKIDTVSQLSA